MVTAGNWRNLWLNEGFSLYLEREAQAIYFGEEYKFLDRVVGNITYMADIDFYGKDNSFVSLFP